MLCKAYTHLFNSIILLCFSLMYWSGRTLAHVKSMRSVCQVMPLSCQCSIAFLRFAHWLYIEVFPEIWKLMKLGLTNNKRKMHVVVDVVIGFLVLPSIYCSILQVQGHKTTASQITSNSTGRLCQYFSWNRFILKETGPVFEEEFLCCLLQGDGFGSSACDMIT